MRVARILAATVCAATALFLFLQPGSSIDEGEHLHVAWLMAVRGLHPVRDFFEHHTPLLWHVLGLLYRAGARGPEVLYPARLFVVGCAAIWCWALVRLARRWSDATPLPAVFGICAFAIVALLTPELMVVRPETLSLGLLGAALICWTARLAAAAAGSGALIALAAFSSPRFALLAPLVLFATPDGAPRWPSWTRLGAAMLGAAAAFAIFVAILCPWNELLFDLRFSGVLQSLPAQIALDLRFVSLPLAVVGILGSVLWALGGPPARIAVAWLGLGALICVGCIVSAGDYLYAQGFAPALAWLAVFITWLESRPWTAASRVSLAAATLATVVAVSLVQLFWAARAPQNVAGLTASRRLLLDALPRGERVLLHSSYHPLTADDASYWGSMLIDGPPGRGCEAAEIYRTQHPGATLLPPPCDFVGDLRANRPFAVLRTLALAAPPERYEQVSRAVQEGWALGDVLNDAPMGSFAANVMFRK